MTFPLQGVIALSLCILLWTVVTVIRRLYFSPLSKFPGPKLAAATLWYEFYFNIVSGGKFMWEIERMHKKYGPIVRINPYELHVNDSEYYDELYAGGSKKRDKYPWFTAGGGSPHSIFETNAHDLHRLRRGALNPFFSKRSIISIEPIIQDKVSKLCTLLQQHLSSKRPIELRQAFSSLTLDVISNYCFGESWNCLGNDKLAKEWKTTLDEVFEKASLIMHFPWIIAVMNSLPDPLAGPIIRHYRNTRKHVSSILRHEEDSKSRKTIFHELRDSELPPQEKTLERLSDEGNILIGAGSETTAQILAVLSYHLISNPDHLARLRKELETVMPDPHTPIKWQQLEQLPYLIAVINEGLRISSPVTTRLPRIAPNEELIFQKWTIPAGIPVSMSYYFIHNDPIIFPSPDQFNPSRWIEAQESGVRLEKYLVPFSRGSRNCIGINLAYAELYLAIAIVFRRFDLQLFETGREDVDTVRDCFVGQPIEGSKGIRVLIVGERE